MTSSPQHGRASRSSNPSRRLRPSLRGLLVRSVRAVDDDCTPIVAHLHDAVQEVLLVVADVHVRVFAVEAVDSEDEGVLQGDAPADEVRVADQPAQSRAEVPSTSGLRAPDADRAHPVTIIELSPKRGTPSNHASSRTPDARRYAAVSSRALIGGIKNTVPSRPRVRSTR